MASTKATKSSREAYRRLIAAVREIGLDTVLTEEDLLGEYGASGHALIHVCRSDDPKRGILCTLFFKPDNGHFRFGSNDGGDSTAMGDEIPVFPEIRLMTRYLVLFFSTLFPTTLKEMLERHA